MSAMPALQPLLPLPSLASAQHLQASSTCCPSSQVSGASTITVPPGKLTEQAQRAKTLLLNHCLFRNLPELDQELCISLRKPHSQISPRSSRQRATTSHSATSEILSWHKKCQQLLFYKPTKPKSFKYTLLAASKFKLLDRQDFKLS